MVFNHGLTNPDKHGFQFHASPNRPTSRGFVKLRSNNPNDNPKIQFNYLETEEDRQQMRDGVKIAREIFSQPIFKDYVGEEIRPGENIVYDEVLDEIIKNTSDTAYHPSCTNKMGIDKMAVVNEETKVHGITNSFLSKHSSFNKQAEKFLDFIQEDTLIIHNAEFDLGFINNELRILEKKQLKNKIIDTVSLARKTLNTRIANLDYLCRRFEIDLGERSLHGALLDSHLLAEVYLELIGGKQISLNLTSTTKNSVFYEAAPIDLPSVVLKIKPTEEEILKHKNMTKQINRPLWEKINY